MVKCVRLLSLSFSGEIEGQLQASHLLVLSRKLIKLTKSEVLLASGASGFLLRIDVRMLRGRDAAAARNRGSRARLICVGFGSTFVTTNREKLPALRAASSADVLVTLWVLIHRGSFA